MRKKGPIKIYKVTWTVQKECFMASSFGPEHAIQKSQSGYGWDGGYWIEKEEAVETSIKYEDFIKSRKSKGSY